MTTQQPGFSMSQYASSTDLFAAMIARITELESQLAQRFDAADMATAAAQGFRDGVTSAPHGQAPACLSPTAGMNIHQRILHVGGRNNDAGYVEFGSTQAVDALVQQVLRDLPAPATADSVQEDAARLDWLLLRISGEEFRRLGVHYSGNARRADVDAARKQGEKQ